MRGIIFMIKKFILKLLVLILPISYATSSEITTKELIDLVVAGNAHYLKSRCSDLLSKEKPIVPVVNIDLFQIIRDEIVETLLNNAKNNAWYSGYASPAELQRSLKVEIDAIQSQNSGFFHDFRFEFDQAIHADPYLLIAYIRDQVEGRTRDDRYRHASFEYELEKYKDMNGSEFHLLTVRYHAHQIYYVFTKEPQKILKDSSKRWAYLNDLDFAKTGRIFTRLKSGSQIRINGNVDVDSYLELEDYIGVHYFYRPKNSIMSSKDLKKNIELYNRLLIDPE